MSQLKIKLTGASTYIQNILQINHIDKNTSNLICLLNTKTGEEAIYYEKRLLVNLKNNILKITKYPYKDIQSKGIRLVIKTNNQNIYIKIESCDVEINTIYEELLKIQNRKYNDEKKHHNNQHLTKKNQKTDPKDVIPTTLTGVIVIVFLFISANLMYIILLDITIRYLPFSLLYDDNFRRNYLEKQSESNRKWEGEQKRKEQLRECKKINEKYNLTESNPYYSDCNKYR